MDLRIYLRHFLKTPPKSPLPWWEGIKGRGDQKVFFLSTPTLTLPHRKGGGELVWKFQIFLVSTLEVNE
jgi:hypothetical protein